MDTKVIHEISPLMGKDVLYIADRRKKEFTYPIHNHEVYELNFVEHAAGVRRIVGDSNEVIGDFDLVLITSPDLEHVWEQNDCKSEDIREVTIQFDIDFTHTGIFTRNPFDSMKKMMIEAQKGLAFPMEAVMRVYPMIDTAVHDDSLRTLEVRGSSAGLQQFCEGADYERQPPCAEGESLH